MYKYCIIKRNELSISFTKFSEVKTQSSNQFGRFGGRFRQLIDLLTQLRDEFRESQSLLKTQDANKESIVSLQIV